MDYTFEELEDGEMVISCSDGRYFNANLVDMMFELHKQNPEFFEHWIKAAASYVMVGNSVLEA